MAPSLSVNLSRTMPKHVNKEPIQLQFDEDVATRSDVKEIALRDYQLEGIREGRSLFAAGNRRIIYCAPTGAGKTVIAAHLFKVLYEHGLRGMFVCDRIDLVSQTSAVFKEYGIPHGIMQGQNTRSVNAKIMICSVDTLTSASRQYVANRLMNSADLIVIDEAHVLNRKFIKMIEEYDASVDYDKEKRKRVIGLTATPFTRGLANVFDDIVNISTTNELIDRGFIVPLRVFVGTEINMSGAKLMNGEWSGTEVERRGTRIVGNVLTEWVQKTTELFGGPVKTLVFSATIAHGEEILKVFNEAGYNFRQVYAGMAQAEREEIIEEFRQKDSEIHGLVSVDMLAKGFDVPDVRCMIGCRPYSRSFAAHIQQIGRVMRSYPGKEFGLVLDHAGNFVGFAEETANFFEHGAGTLKNGIAKKKVVRKEREERADIVCTECGYVMKKSDRLCISCGAQRKRKRQAISQASGTLKELGDLRSIIDKKKQDHGMSEIALRWIDKKQWVWDNICRVAHTKKPIREQAKKFALAQYRAIFNNWPPYQFDYEPDGIEPDPIVEEVVRYNHARHTKAWHTKKAKTKQWRKKKLG